MTVLFLVISGPKFMKFWDVVGGPSQFPKPFPDCLVPCQRYSHSEVATELRSGRKQTVFGPQIFVGLIPKKISLHCSIADRYTSCVKVSLKSVQRCRRNRLDKSNICKTDAVAIQAAANKSVVFLAGTAGSRTPMPGIYLDGDRLVIDYNGRSYQ